MPRNIELKARLPSLEAARAIARQVATASLGVEHQVDTYFACRQGRLKLREIAGRDAQLVWYARADTAAAKASEYTLVAVAHPAALKQALAGACGVTVVVDKRREIYLHHNVRIHLDEVRGLGAFLEFEAVVGEAADDAQGRGQVEALTRRFGLQPEDLVAGSYSDLLGG